MAKFEIGSQTAHVIQQAETIYNPGRVDLGTSDGISVSGQIRSLLNELEALVEAGEVDESDARQVHAALEDAVITDDPIDRSTALGRISRIAAGTAALAGIAESTNHVIGLLSGG